MAARRAPLTVVVLAAGQGTRMRSKTIKLLHPVAGEPMVSRVLDTVAAVRPARTVTVIGFQADLVRQALSHHDVHFALQKQQRGTGHAVLQAAKQIPRNDRSTLVVLNGDLPTLRPETLRALVARHRRARAALTLLTAAIEDPTGYGRIVRGERGTLSRIVEHADASRAEREIREINVGLYCARADTLLGALSRLKPNNAQGEYYITDAVHALIARGERVLAHVHRDAEEVLGVNTRAELTRASRALYRRKAEALQDRGVTLLDAERTWIDPRARVGRDTLIYPDVIVEGASVIGEDCVVRSGVRIADTRIGRGAQIKDHSVLLSCVVGRDAEIGPFAHVRPGSTLGPNTKIGNFVELKKTRLGPGSKASHLAYLGDAEIGADCNIGAGTITCNYDGRDKHRTVLERGVFVGSDSQLVAPVTVKRGAYVAAGTTVTEDVPARSLAIGRSRQRNVKGWAVRKAKGRSARK